MRVGIFLTLFAAALGLASAAKAAPAPASCVLGQVAELPVTMSGLSPLVTATVNGVEVRFLLDSGAFYSSMTEDAAKHLGVKLDPAPFGFQIVGVGGAVTPKFGHAKELGLGGSTLQGVDFLVFGRGSAEGTVGLLGQEFLRRFDVEYDLARGMVRFFRPDHCEDRSLAYWVQPDQTYSVIRTGATTALEPHIVSSATLNGDRIRVMFDTGASRSLLTRAAAAKAGVTSDMAGVVAGGTLGGIGPRRSESWISPFKSFVLGDEEIRNAKLRFGATEIGAGGTDMLIGADFFLSHRVLMSNSQRQLYFTYNGGPVFNLDRLDQTAAISPEAAPAAGPAKPDPDAPTDALGFKRRGAASAARGDYARAIADLTRALELQPDDAQTYFDRSEIHRAGGQAKLARADLDKALALKPGLVPALLSRARLSIVNKDDAQARLDLEAVLGASPSNETLVRVAIIAGGGPGLYGDALRYYERWILANPKHENMSEVLNNRCWLRATAGKELDKALADCNAALKLRPKAANILDSRGLVRLRLGQFDAAIADYDAALKLQPKQAWSMYGRGLAKQRMGLKDAGDADIKAALAVAPAVADEAKRYGLTP